MLNFEMNLWNLLVKLHALKLTENYATITRLPANIVTGINQKNILL